MYMKPSVGMFNPSINTPVDVPLLVEIDYTQSDDWIDRECKDCGRLDNKHAVDCLMIIRTWIEMADKMGNCYDSNDSYYLSYKVN